MNMGRCRRPFLIIRWRRTLVKINKKAKESRFCRRERAEPESKYMQEKQKKRRSNAIKKARSEEQGLLSDARWRDERQTTAPDWTFRIREPLRALVVGRFASNVADV